MAQAVRTILQTNLMFCLQFINFLLNLQAQYFFCLSKIKSVTDFNRQ